MTKKFTSAALFALSAISLAQIATARGAEELTLGAKCQQFAHEKLGLPRLPEADEVPMPEYKIETLPDQRVRVTVHHALIRGVTLAQMAWWYRNLANPNLLKLDGEMKECRPYVILDDDHNGVAGLDLTQNGELKTGSRLRFEEVTPYQGKVYKLKEEVYISEINPSYMQYEKRKLFGLPMGLNLATTDRYFTEEPGGVRVVSILTAGINGDEYPTLAKMNSFLIGKLFVEGQQMAWVEHTSHEIGNLEIFIPWLQERTEAASSKLP